MGILFLVGHGVLALVVGLSVFPLRSRNPQVTSIMRYRGSQTGGYESASSFVALTRIPKTLVASVVYVEDYDFFRHNGFDLESIRYAMKLNRRLGYLAYGGSTITQQLARTLFLTPRKTYVRKYIELLIAVEMEMILSKERILELYLNVAEWGNGVYGVGGGSMHHYGKGLSELSLDEQLRLVTILPNPLGYTPETFENSGVLLSRYRALRRLAQRMNMGRPRLVSDLRELP